MKVIQTIHSLYQEGCAKCAELLQYFQLDNSNRPPSTDGASLSVINVSHTAAAISVNCDPMKAWPFMFSRSFSEDYGAVVVPEFIYEKGKGACRELRSACDNFEDMAANEAIHMQCFHPDVGAFDLLVRKIVATERMLGKDSDKILRDEAGRRIIFMEGFAFPGRLSPQQLRFTQAQFAAAQETNNTHFRRYWQADKDRPEPAVSKTIALPASEGEVLTLKLMATDSARAALSPSHPPTLPKPPEQSSLSHGKGFLTPHKPEPRTPRTGGGLNKTAAFFIVTGVAIGSYLVYRHFAKNESKQINFAARIAQERSESSPSHHNR